MANRLDNSGTTAKQETFGYHALDHLTSAETQLGNVAETRNPAERTLSYAYDKHGHRRPGTRRQEVRSTGTTIYQGACKSGREDDC